ncbi:D-arabinose 1-dehydrogenase-like Zn-dependent alcohol dehydrogenase [Pseudonocardia sediminis]|uniref:alcohol dehydrogenase n=2 Tax=Pseudonocardia sediminis TaxID=1397368 RepID=A0A4Q7UYE2_PSEST|nr:D-arabinose 1-dehydrogenase-like Zn-dependent alcohol dehydrogenase [Pseudonocardia sediminis]
MRVVELDGTGDPGVLVPGTRPTPRPGPGELLVRVGACGVCGHDALARRGALAACAGAVLGHEIAGRVVALGTDVPGGWLGKRVALVQRIPCGRCDDCTDGATTHCRSGPGFYGEDLDGGYAEYVRASPLNAVELPDEIDDATGAILSCAVGTGLRALRSAEVGPGQVVIVTGAGGGVGLHTVALARHLGARVVGVVGSPAKADAVRAAGADSVHPCADITAGAAISAHDLRDAVRALGSRRGAHVVIETTGAPTFSTALRALAPRGRLVLVGNTVPGPLPLDPGLTIVKELRVSGSAHADRDDLTEVVELVADGAITPVPARRRPLSEVADAHAELDARTVIGRSVVIP